MKIVMRFLGWLIIAWMGLASLMSFFSGAYKVISNGAMFISPRNFALCVAFLTPSVVIVVICMMAAAYLIKTRNNCRI